MNKAIVIGLASGAISACICTIFKLKIPWHGALGCIIAVSLFLMTGCDQHPPPIAQTKQEETKTEQPAQQPQQQGIVERMAGAAAAGAAAGTAGSVAHTATNEAMKKLKAKRRLKRIRRTKK